VKIEDPKLDKKLVGPTINWCAKIKGMCVYLHRERENMAYLALGFWLFGAKLHQEKIIWLKNGSTL